MQGLGQAGAIAAIASLGLFNRGKHNGWNANKRKDAKKKMGGMPKIQPRAFFFGLGDRGSSLNGGTAPQEQEENRLKDEAAKKLAEDLPKQMCQ